MCLMCLIKMNVQPEALNLILILLDLIIEV